MKSFQILHTTLRDVNGSCDKYLLNPWSPRAGNTMVKSLKFRGFPGGTVVENLPANAGDTGSIPGLGRSHMLRSN